MKLSVTYVFHACFVVRSPKALLVFDFWQRPEGWMPFSPFVGSSPICESDMQKPVYLFVSHFHKDHYNKEIFSWASLFPDIRYVISRDTARHARHILRPDSLYSGPRPNPDDVTVLAPGQTFSDEVLSVSAFDSTDIGCSWVISLDGRNILHAGDLNAWLWKDESTPEEVESARNAFLSCLRPLVERFPDIDLALFPVDSRIGSDYQEGARLLLRKANVRVFIPMHFTLGVTPEERERLRRDAIDFDSYAPESPRTLFAALTAPGDSLYGL